MSSKCVEEKKGNEITQQIDNPSIMWQHIKWIMIDICQFLYKEPFLIHFAGSTNDILYEKEKRK